MNRKGYGIGRGQGYKNLIKGYDQHIHSQSSKGIKQPQRFKIFVRPEGESKLRPTKVWFKDRKKAETFANIETSAGMGEMYFVKGGKVPFNISGVEKTDLPIETAIYVPSTDKNQKQIGKSQYQKRLKETEDFLSNLYGGFTRFDDIGGYKTLKRGIIKEKGARVVAFASKKDIKSKQKSAQLKNFILKKQKEWGQESIGYENEGDLHYLSTK